jgi:hypothetical protein
MATINVDDATVKIYRVSDNTLIDTSTTSGDNYLLEDLRAGNYYYHIDAPDLGNHIDFISIPNDYNAQDKIDLLKSISVELFEASPDMDITVTNKTPAAVAGLTVKIDNIVGTDETGGVYSFTALDTTKVPQNPAGCLVQINTSNNSYEKWKDRRIFDETDGSFAHTLADAFELRVQFRVGALNVTNDIDFCVIRYNYSIGQSLNITIDKTSGIYFKLGSNVAHTGEIVIIPTLPQGLIFSSGENIKSFTHTDIVNGVINVNCAMEYELS